jgi:UPF0755 protein
MPDPLDPQKFHIMSDKTRKKLVIVSVVFAFVIFPLLALQYYKIAINRPSQLDKEINFEIKSGEGVAVIGENLYKAGALNSEFLFSLYVFLNKFDRNIQAGVYTIPAGTSVVELAQLFQHGVNDRRITFIEGWRVEEFARVAAKQFEKIDYNEFVRKAAQYEGYLFPDTYYFEKDIREDDMIARLTQTFDTKTKNILTEANLSASGLSKVQAITLASIVEREVDNDKDRKLVAGILLKRFKSNELLGADATTQYAVAQRYLCGPERMAQNMCTTSQEEINQFNWWPKELTQEDLDQENPFNTRKLAGIPPHPISNPGLASLEAVIRPDFSDYNFYLTDDKGITHYAKTLDEHNSNIAEFLR